MKPWTKMAATLLVAVSVGSRAADPMTSPPLDPAVPTALDLDPDFTPPAGEGSMFLGIRRLRGYALEERNGVHPICIIEALEGVIANNPLRVGDVLIAVNGAPLGRSPVHQFRTTVAEASRGSGVLWVTRWRKGEIERCLLDLGTRPQDLTRGGTPNPNQIDWNLGATGAEGWTWSIPHQTTEGATQIYVTKVDPGSPADGVLRVEDVILGALGVAFKTDARKEFGNALAEAETSELGGRLALTIWSEGQTREVTLPMRTMGRYSETSPFHCEKSDRIIDEACAYLRKAGLGKGSIVRHVNALALLATGREEFAPLLREHARTLVDESAGYASKLGVSAWATGYGNLFLTEYYLLTGDASVLQAIREYTLALARGQSRVGSWGQRTCTPYSFADGPRHGIAPGYGAMNQSSLVCLISMILARKCGVEEPEVAEAIARGAAFFRFYVDKGSVPYGDHQPGIGDHDDNGKNSLAAVMFDLLGDEEAATYFARMATASFEEREFGHTGNYFSFLWGALGAARGGEEAAAAFMDRLRWFYDLERRWEGNFVYQGKPGMDRRQNAEHQYVGWDCTGARLLAYCLPLRKLHITGKGGGVVRALKGHALADVVAVGELRKDAYAQLPSGKLLAKLKSWSPVVRERAAKALGAKDENVVPQLVALLEGEDRFGRYGACAGLRHAGRGSAEAADAVIARALSADDPTLRYAGIDAFQGNAADGGLTAVAVRALPELLRLAAVEHPDDSVNRIQFRLAEVLFQKGSGRVPLVRAETLAAMDRLQLLLALREFLKAPNGMTRSLASSLYGALTEQDLALLWGDIHEASRDLAPSGIMFASEVRMNGIELMAAHRTREGLETAVAYLRDQKPHGSQKRIDTILKIIVERYGGHARPLIPQMLMIADYFENEETDFPRNFSRLKAAKVREAVATIETMPPPTDRLVSIAPYLGKE